MKPFYFLLFFLAAVGCSDEKKDGSLTKDTEALQASSADSTVLGDEAVVNVVPVGVFNPNAPALQLVADASHDAFDFTIGVAELNIPSLTNDYRLSTTRSILNGSGRSLSAEEKAVLTRLCREIGLSSSPDSYVALDRIGKGQKAYLMWRSYYSEDARSLLSDIALGGGSIECMLSLNLGGSEINLGFDPAPADVSKVAGSSKLAEAVSAGLMLPKPYGVLRPGESGVVVPVAAAPRFALKVEPLDAARLSVKSSQVLTNECALSSDGGKTHVVNPYAVNVLQYELETKLDVSVAAPILRRTGGRILAECKAMKLDAEAKAVVLQVTCGQYQAISEQGVEAGCAFDFVASNDKDPENTASVPVQMNKIRYKNVDLSSVSEAIKLMPKSYRNPLRKGELRLSGFNRTQAGAFEDLFDLWIAIDEAGYDREFSGHVKTISYSNASSCKKGAGAYTPYGGDTIYWCSSGGMGESEVANRYADPQMFVYRTMLAYHESRHANGIYHDSEKAAYEPCQGTAYSGFFAHQIVTQCDYDYCKVMRDGAIFDYKLELNYDYDGDATGRKGQGLCREWSKAMGISGGGF